MQEAQESAPSSRNLGRFLQAVNTGLIMLCFAELRDICGWWVVWDCLSRWKTWRSIIKSRFVPRLDRFRPRPGERRLVVGADVVVHHGGQEAGRGADRQRTLGQVRTPLLLQVASMWLHRCFDCVAGVSIKVSRCSSSSKHFRPFDQPQNQICLLLPSPNPLLDPPNPLVVLTVCHAFLF